MANNDNLMEARALAEEAVPVREIELRVEIDSDQQSVKYRLPHVRDRIGEELRWRDVNIELAGIGSAIYIIEQIDENADFEKTYNNFKRYKESEKTKAEGERKHCSGINITCPKSVIFIGSCENIIGQMIKTHIGNSSEQTWALHLKFWFEGEIKITVKEYNVSPEVLQIIKGDLIDQLRPMFGS